MTDTDDAVRWLALHKGEFKGISKRTSEKMTYTN
jgi:hypothetical protein